MPLLSLLLQQSRKLSLDSSFQSLEKITPVSFFSVENPILFSLILLGVILAVVFIFYRYVIIPMRKRHLQVQENLRLEQAELMALFAELSPDPVFRIDDKGKIIHANNSAHRKFPHHSLVGEQAKDLFAFIKEFDLDEIISSNNTVNYTALIDKRYFQFLISGVQRFRICHIYGRDITELKQIEQDLIHALEKAEESKKLKEFFLSQISHEVRSPLNAIIGYSDLLMQDYENIDPEVSDSLRAIINNGKRLYRTFDLLINMSQLQTGMYETRFEKVDIYSLLKTLKSEFSTLAAEKNIMFELFKKTEDTIGVLDHYSISQVFSNLIDNAIKYTNEGKIEITIYRNNNSNLCIDISDTGIGIPKEYQTKLFTSFSQADMRFQKSYEGTGLGLSLVKSFIDLNKAKLKMESEPGNTTFTIILSGNKKWSTIK